MTICEEYQVESRSLTPTPATALPAYADSEGPVMLKPTDPSRSVSSITVSESAKFSCQSQK